MAKRSTKGQTIMPRPISGFNANDRETRLYIKGKSEAY